MPRPLLAFLVAALFLPRPAWAQPVESLEDSPGQEKLEREASRVADLEVLRRRALKEKKQKPAPAVPRFKHYLELSQGAGYESNPRRNASRTGDAFLENTLAAALSKKLSPRWSWQGFYYGSFTNYLEYGDGDYAYQTLTPLKLLWKPAQTWRLDLEMEVGDLLFPSSSVHNYRWLRPSVGAQQELPGGFLHAGQLDWQIRKYGSQKAKSGSGAETLDDRVDTRPRVRYEIGNAWKRTVAKVRQEWYWNDSNDARNDFYDAQGYKVTASLRQKITKKLLADIGYSFERRNYRKRPVTGITSEARYDDTHTWSLSGLYELNETWRIGSSFSYRFLDSNDPTGEYVDATITGTVSARL